MNAPFVRQPDPFRDRVDAAWPSDDCCDLCCATPVRTELDGDKLCQSCADKWVRAEGQAAAEDDELRHALRHASVYRGALIEARLEDNALHAISKDHKRFVRDGGRA